MSKSDKFYALFVLAQITIGVLVAVVTASNGI
jgi:hypothetical protein